MKIETVALDDQQTRLIAELDSETLEKYKHQAARKISKSTKIPGFRPGKAPYDLVRRMYGDEALQQEAVEIMLDEIYPQVLREANINPSGPGKLEEIVSMDPPKFAFVVPMPPEVTLGDYKSIRKEYAPEPISDEQVDQTIQRLQRSYATAEPVERPAQKGDMVSFKLSAKRTHPEEGQPENLVEETPYQMIAGEEESEEESWPYKGFSNELIGMSAGETKTVTHTFDEESPYEDLRGAEAEFTVQIDNIKEMHLPELNDEFAQSLGEFETVDALRSMVRRQLEQSYSQQYEQKYFDDLIGELVAQSTVKYPPHMLEEEVEEFLHGVEHDLEHDRLDLDTYLKMREMDRDTFIEKEVKPAATRRLMRSLVLEELARQEKVEVNNEEIRSIFYAAQQQLQNSAEMQQLRSKTKQSSREMANNLAINTVNNIFNQRLMGRLKAIATGKGDEEAAPEEQATLEMQSLYSDEASANDEAITEAAVESDVVESSAPTSAAAAADEQAVSEDDLLDEEPPQADKDAGGEA